MASEQGSASHRWRSAAAGLGMLLSGAAMVSCLVWVARARGDELADRRAKIEQMDPAAKEHLRKNLERFNQLDPAVQEQLRDLHRGNDWTATAIDRTLPEPSDHPISHPGQDPIEPD